jgi:outer membrane protein assembly factor BamB
MTARNTGASEIPGVYVPGRKPWSFRTGRGDLLQLATVGPGDRVYVGSGDGRLPCIRREPGKSLWRFKAA